MNPKEPMIATLQRVRDLTRTDSRRFIEMLEEESPEALALLRSMSGRKGVPTLAPAMTADERDMLVQYAQAHLAKP
jgi:hypothetical protein